ncbi:hypothetical protein MSj_01571 [Microcystis aeruginosa Sj]|jgi:hypothetical protein|uniref:Uncharacterized protein n=1 Tax=Microcystis aeruginosa Sj TaxID=1979544 RepID=A0A2Z6UW41_MICAE|nr:hypothetical protein [Microcystis aeruginosa]GBL10088.1 hypothetical protein MSj_01571 [Microcystis aeruginosa Sj]
MPFDPISWAIIGFIVGGLTVAFWDEIVEWADRTFARILNSINKAINVVSDRVVYLVTGRSGVYEKKLAVYTQNINTGQYGQNIVSEIITDTSKIPDDVLAQLKKQREVRVLQNKK